MESGFEEFLERLEDGEGKKEYLLPDIIDRLLREEKAQVKVLWSGDQWFGVTYQGDKKWVEKALREVR